MNRIAFKNAHILVSNFQSESDWSKMNAKILIVLFGLVAAVAGTKLILSISTLGLIWWTFYISKSPSAVFFSYSD